MWGVANVKELMAIVSGPLGKRFSSKQKERFIRFVMEYAQMKRLKCTLDAKPLGFGTCRNLYLGNLKHSKFLLAIPYDTSTKILWPGIRYYPADQKKNLLQESMVKGLDILLAAAILITCYVLTFRIGKAVQFSALFAAALLSGKILFGWANRNNYSRNSASIVLALECLERFPSGSISVAFLDYSCCGLQGYQQLCDYLTQKGLQKKLLVIDCIASGEELHLHGEKKLPVAEGVQSHLIHTGGEKTSIWSIFPDCLLLSGGQQINGTTAIFHTRTKKDCQVRLDKMKHVMEFIHRLAEEPM